MERQEIPNQLVIIEIKPEDEYQAESKDLMEITPDESDLIGETPERDESALIEETHEHDESEINIKPEFQVHVAVSQDENITDSGPKIYSPIEVTPFKIETEENQQIEDKTEFEWLINTNTEVKTEYQQSTKVDIEDVNVEYNQTETDQSRSDRMSLEQTELNQHQEEVSY